MLPSVNDVSKVVNKCHVLNKLIYCYKQDGHKYTFDIMKIAFIQNDNAVGLNTISSLRWYIG